MGMNCDIEVGVARIERPYRGGKIHGSFFDMHCLHDHFFP